MQLLLLHLHGSNSMAAVEVSSGILVERHLLTLLTSPSGYTRPQCPAPETLAGNS